MSNVEITDNSEIFKDAVKEQMEAALEAIGQLAEGHAKANLTRFPRVDTGRLRGSISHQISGGAAFFHNYADKSGSAFSQLVGSGDSTRTAYIGTNVSYAPYVEFGTGPLAEDAKGNKGIGRQDVPWFYKDEEGKGHLSYGMKPSHFLQRAAADHTKEYRSVALSYLKGQK